MQADDESFDALRAGIDRLAAKESPAILAEARAEARARVRSMLTEAIALSMLERMRELLERSPAATEPGPAEQPRPESSPLPRPAPPRSETLRSSATGSGELGWYVYGVTAAGCAGAESEAPGIDPAHPVRTVAEDELCAVASRVRLDEFGEAQLREHLADMDWLEATARAHERVLDTVRDRTTVIPMRLCTVYRSEQGAREMLRQEAAALREALGYLEHKTEWGVKVFASAGQDQLDPRDDPAAGGPGSGAAYMERRRRERGSREAASQRIEEACEQIHDRLGTVSADSLLSPPQRPEVTGRDSEMVLNGVYLVPDDAQQAFHQQFRELRAEFESAGLALELTGPWPAYNFVPGTIGAAW